MSASIARQAITRQSAERVLPPRTSMPALPLSYQGIAQGCPERAPADAVAHPNPGRAAAQPASSDDDNGVEKSGTGRSRPASFGRPVTKPVVRRSGGPNGTLIPLQQRCAITLPGSGQARLGSPRRRGPAARRACPTVPHATVSTDRTDLSGHREVMPFRSVDGQQPALTRRRVARLPVEGAVAGGRGLGHARSHAAGPGM